MPDLHFATVWEAVADTVPDADAIVQGEARLSWGDYDEQAARLAGTLAAHGVGPGASVGMYLFNGPEYLVTQYAGFKLRAVPVNVSYRYLADELAYLLGDSAAEAVVFHSSLSDRVAAVRERAPQVKVWIEVDDGGPHLDGALSWKEALAGPPAPRIDRPGDDLYVLYTGGTTGMPKGVQYRQADFAAMWLGLAALSVGAAGGSVDDVPVATRAAADAGQVPRTLVACPLMHGTGMWLGAFVAHSIGGAVVLTTSRSFDPHEAWRLVESERCRGVVIVGDAFARPLLNALDEAVAGGTAYDLSSLTQMVSSGVMWSAEVKQGLLRHADLVLLDAMGSTEGALGTSITTRANVSETASFTLGPATKVFTDDGREVQPGTGEMGMLASPAMMLGYRGDPAKTAQTIREIDGVRYVFPGDYATVEPDGSIRLLGRGSQCINTGGEKVFPEEVEEAVKRHPDVADCLVVGLPDERFGEQVVAVASLRPGSSVSADDLGSFVRDDGHLAHYKLPRRVVLVEAVRRAPNGKADYPWAREAATSA
jgi:fatty-acyl-CoA synthase